MNHESRERLTLAASGALSPEDQRAVEEHVRSCEVCRGELEVLQMYAGSLASLPQPRLPAGLLERTQAALLAEERPAEPPWVLLVLLSWASGMAMWAVARGLGFEWLGSVWTWTMVSTLLTWSTAGAAALVLGKQGGHHEPAK